MTTFSKICNLENIEFISGENYSIEFTVYNEDTTPTNLSSVVSKGISISYFGLNEELFYKEGGVVSGSGYNVFTCEILSSDTLNIDGKLIYQLIIVDDTGKTFKLGQGIITLLPAIR